MDNTIHSVVIIGSGPAGLTAAIYAGRANLHPVVIDGMQPGGQLMITTDVENYPGFPEGITGPELMDLFRKQATRFGTTFIEDEATSVDVTQKPFHINLGSGDVVLAKTVIIASGASAQWLGLESEKRLQGKGVSACATCDGFFYRGKVVAVVGGGDTAMEEASYLTHHASKVYLIHRRDAFRASKIMQDRVLSNPKIEVVWNSIVEDILDDGAGKFVTGVRVKNVKTGEVKDISCDGYFVAIGHKPNTNIVRDVLKTDGSGYLLHVPDSSETDIPGVFVAGDVHDNRYRQAITAAGAGCRAAIDAERWLETQAHA
ncbi:thioredoxin-disulfide reductase [candidate division KSB1 bacterium]|nr:MAG: thioredoxin-disulfide reductase [candidate division KSB1 bacterium]